MITYAEGLEQASEAHEIADIMKTEGAAWIREFNEFIKTLPERSRDPIVNLKKRTIPTMEKYDELDLRYPRYAAVRAYICCRLDVCHD